MKKPWEYFKKIKNAEGDRTKSPLGKTPICPRCDRTESVSPPNAHSPWTCTYCCEDITPIYEPLTVEQRRARNIYRYGHPGS